MEEQETKIPFNLPSNGKLYHKDYKGDFTYAVFKIIQTGSKKTTIKYNVNIRFYYKNKNDKYYLSIDMVSETYINNKEPSLVAEEMALACTKALYPIVLEVDKDGSLIDIQYHHDILERWENQKIQNFKYYKGEIAEKYFALFEQTLKDKNVLFQYIQKDWFYGIYFNNLYTTYNNYELTRTIDFPIIPNTNNVQYHINQKIEPNLVNNHVKIELKGKCVDARSRTDLENGLYFPSLTSKIHVPVNGDFNALYFLNSRTLKIESAYLRCTLDLKKNKSVAIKVTKVEDEIEMKEKRHPVTIAENKEEKVSFWKTLFS